LADGVRLAGALGLVLKGETLRAQMAAKAAGLAVLDSAERVAAVVMGLSSKGRALV
jgi:hypothetical protein